MADPAIVPPTPTVTQPSRPDAPVTPPKPVDKSAGIEQVQSIFDKVLPPKGVEIPKPKPQIPTPEPAPPQPQPQPVPEIPEPKSQIPKEEPKLPSFFEETIKEEIPKPKPQAPSEEVETEWAEDLPAPEKQSRIKGLRDAYKRVKEELKGLKERPPDNHAALERMAFLEHQNRQMSEILSRVGVEHSADFQRNIMQPLYASWNEAARIVRESGGNPEELRAAMSQNGRAQFEALDTLFADMPESAKAEAHDALRNYRRYEAARAAAVADSPRTMEALRQRETQRQYQEMGQARNEMKQMFENALSTLRDEAKVEVFLKTNDPETEWWNKQGETITEQARNLFLENTDLNKVAFACLLAPAADAYRNLFMKAQRQVAELKQIIKDKGWQEPVLSESSGNAGNLTPDAQLQADLKRPFNEVFLREFHKSQAQRR